MTTSCYIRDIQFLQMFGPVQNCPKNDMYILQIRMNLWNKKVYDILFRLCGCKCGHGYLKHEEEIILPPPKPVQLKKTLTKAQLKPELKDVKLKKAKKLSSKSALSESFKRHQEVKKEIKSGKAPDMQGWRYKLISNAGENLDESILEMIMKKKNM